MPGYSLDSDEDFVQGQDLFIADASLSAFIAFAYKLDLQNSMLEKLPKWASGQTFDIRAKISGHPTKDQVREMMRTLLKERFHLDLRFEDQEKSVLALTLIREGELGQSLHHHVSCKLEGSPPKSGDAITNIGWLPCNQYLALDRAGGAVFIAARNTTMKQMCAFLSTLGSFGRMVVDRSGLIGPIDFSLEYTKDRLNTAEDPANNSESLETALKSQLGVKLSPIKAQVNVPIIDNLDPLIAN